MGSAIRWEGGAYLNLMGCRLRRCRDGGWRQAGASRRQIMRSGFWYADASFDAAGLREKLVERLG